MISKLGITGCVSHKIETAKLTIIPTTGWGDTEVDYEKEGRELYNFLTGHLPLGTWRSFSQINEIYEDEIPQKKQSVGAQLGSANDDLLRIIELTRSDDWLRVMYNADRQDAADDVIERAKRLLAEIRDVARGIDRG